MMKSKRMRWGHLAHTGGKNAYRIFVGKPGERTLGRPRCRWENKIKTDLREISWGAVD
jgi:hypothetical protein